MSQPVSDNQIDSMTGLELLALSVTQLEQRQALLDKRFRMLLSKSKRLFALLAVLVILAFGLDWSRSQLNQNVVVLFAAILFVAVLACTAVAFSAGADCYQTHMERWKCRKTLEIRRDSSA